MLQRRSYNNVSIVLECIWKTEKMIFYALVHQNDLKENWTIISAGGCLRQRRIIALLGTPWKRQGTEIPTVDRYTFTKGTMSFLRGKLEQESWSFFFNDPRMEAKTRSKEFFEDNFPYIFQALPAWGI